jgi:16S rRNA (guanine527-N7)-methyltransferase
LDRPRDPLPTRVADLPPLPEAYAAVLEPGLAALGLTLDPAVRAAVDGHARMLLAWTAAINLTAIRDPEGVARLHVLDSLAAVPLLRELGADAILDLGSGGGFPGLPLAAVLGLDRTLLVDSIGKKVTFLRAAIEAVGLGGRVAAENGRAEQLAHDPRDRERWPVVVSRAMTDLAQLVELALPLVAPGGVLIAWKREPVEEDLAAAAKALHVLRAGPVTVREVAVPGLETHRLVIVPRGGRVEMKYPRDPAERKRHPL